jgi:hypothetical protein
VLLQHEPGRYTFHDLLREHARITVSAEETAAAQHDALTRLFDHYLYTACTAADLLYPYSRHLRPPHPRTGYPRRALRRRNFAGLLGRRPRGELADISVAA